MFERMKKIGVSVVMALTLCVQGNIVFAEEEESKPLSGVGGKNIIQEYDPEIQKLTFTNKVRSEIMILNITNNFSRNVNMDPEIGSSPCVTYLMADRENQI